MRPRTWLLLVTLVLAVAGVLVEPVIASLASAIGDRGRPIPRAPPESALPPLPAERENGWMYLEGPLAGDEIPADPEHRPPTAGEDGWPVTDAALDVLVPELAAWSPPADADDARADVFVRPRFVPACPLEMHARCTSSLVWLHAHRAVAALALRDGLDGDLVAALVTLDDLLRTDDDAVRNARTLLDLMIAEVCASESARAARTFALVLGRRRARGESLAAVAPLLRPLEARLEAMDPLSWSPASAVTGDWVRAERGLEAAEALPHPGADVRRARVLVGEHFEAVLAFARDPSLPAPVAAPIDAWWRRLDARGARIAEAFLSDVDAAAIVRFRRRAPEIDADRRAALDALAALRVNAIGAAAHAGP